MSMKAKAILLALIVFVFLVLGVLLMYRPSVSVSRELVGTELPIVSDMIFLNKSDPYIVDYITENPESLREVRLNVPYSMRTPLLTALIFERWNLAKRMVTAGVPIEPTRSFLEQEGEWTEPHLKQLDMILSETRHENLDKEQGKAEEK